MHGAVREQLGPSFIKERWSLKGSGDAVDDKNSSCLIRLKDGTNGTLYDAWRRGEVAVVYAMDRWSKSKKRDSDGESVKRVSKGFQSFRDLRMGCKVMAEGLSDDAMVGYEILPMFERGAAHFDCDMTVHKKWPFTHDDAGKEDATRCYGGAMVDAVITFLSDPKWCNAGPITRRDVLVLQSHRTVGKDSDGNYEPRDTATRFKISFHLRVPKVVLPTAEVRDLEKTLLTKFRDEHPGAASIDLVVLRSDCSQMRLPFHHKLDEVEHRPLLPVEGSVLGTREFAPSKLERMLQCSTLHKVNRLAAPPHAVPEHEYVYLSETQLRQAVLAHDLPLPRALSPRNAISPKAATATATATTATATATATTTMSDDDVALIDELLRTRHLDAGEGAKVMLESSRLSARIDVYGVHVCHHGRECNSNGKRVQRRRVPGSQRSALYLRCGYTEDACKKECKHIGRPFVYEWRIGVCPSEYVGPTGERELWEGIKWVSRQRLCTQVPVRQLVVEGAAFARLLAVMQQAPALLAAWKAHGAASSPRAAAFWVHPPRCACAYCNGANSMLTRYSFEPSSTENEWLVVSYEGAFLVELGAEPCDGKHKRCGQNSCTRRFVEQRHNVLERAHPVAMGVTQWLEACARAAHT